MVRKGKDLFVILAERQERSKAKSKSKAPAVAARTPAQTIEGEAGNDVGAAVGRGVIGRWVTGAVRTMRGAGSTDQDGDSRSRWSRRGSAGSGAGSGGETSRPTRSRNTAPRQVPRGLLMPGWLLFGMVIAALGGGFLAGRFTSGGRPDQDLNTGGTVKTPGAFVTDRERQFVLDEAAEEAKLHGFFHVLKPPYPPEERAAAARLALALRARGIDNARIRPFYKNGSLYAWAVLCYAASFADAKPVLQDLKRLQGELGYEVDPQLKQF